MKQLIFILALLAQTSLSSAQSVGRVIKVIDGDTFDVLVNKIKVRCRLANVDAPEKDQFYGLSATQEVQALTAGKMCMVSFIGTDLYQRMLVDLRIDGMALDSLLIARGCAWKNVFFATRIGLEGVEQEARKQRLGLWTCRSPTPPWIWRKFTKRNRQLFNACL